MLSLIPAEIAARLSDIVPVDAATRRRMRRYFMEAAPNWPVRAIWVGAGAAVGGLIVALTGLAVAIGCVLLVLGAALAAVGCRFAIQPPGVATDAEVDRVIKSDVASVQALALGRCNLDPADLRQKEACYFRTRSLGEIGAALRGTRTGKDKKERWTPQDVTVVNFGHDQLFLYRCTVDLTTGNSVYEEVREISYRDVVSVETTTARDTLTVREGKDDALRLYWSERGGVVVNGVLQVDGRQVLCLRLTSGDALQIAVWDGQLAKLQPDEATTNGPAARRLRRLVREMKQQATRSQRPPRIVRHSGGES